MRNPGVGGSEGRDQNRELYLLGQLQYDRVEV